MDEVLVVLLEPEELEGLVELVVLHLPHLFILYTCVNVFIFVLSLLFRLSCSSFIICTLI